MRCLMFYCWSREVEDSPVCQGADCGVAGEEEGAGCAGDAVGRELVLGMAWMVWLREVHESTLSTRG